AEGETYSETYYSIGGGFVVREERVSARENLKAFNRFPYQVENAAQLQEYCQRENKTIWEIVLENERSLRTDEEIDRELQRVWDTMLECMYIGCHTEGTLPGGLQVRRRAYDSYQKLKGDLPYSTPWEWLETIR